MFSLLATIASYYSHDPVQYDNNTEIASRQHTDALTNNDNG